MREKYTVGMSYVPRRYTITDGILESIGQIEACKAVIENAPLIPSWEREFVIDAKARTVHYSTHLEGNPLDFPDVKKIIEGYESDIVARDRDVYEVINYREAVKYIEELFEKAKKNKKTSSDIFSLDLISKIHSILSNKILSDDRRGAIRVRPADLVSSEGFRQVLIFPKPERILPLLKKFVSWMNSSDAIKTHPVLKSGIVHYELTRIHPFDDQNGRTARTLSTLVLYLDGYDIKSFFSLDEHFDEDPLGYYNALASAQKSEGDLTGWLEYFCLGLSIELNRVKEKVLKLSKDVKLKEAVGQIALNERQERLVNYIQDYGYVNNKKWKGILPDYSDDTILRDVKDLIKKKVVKKVGSTKSARYVLR